MKQSDTTADRPGDELPRLGLHKLVTVGLAVVTGARAEIHRWPLALPGQKVGGAATWLYPVQPPH